MKKGKKEILYFLFFQVKVQGKWKRSTGHNALNSKVLKMECAIQKIQNWSKQQNVEDDSRHPFFATPRHGCVTRGPKIKRGGEVGANVVNAQLKVEHSLELFKVPPILFYSTMFY